MIKRLRKVGNSNALILDKAVLELVGLSENGEVELAVREGAIVVTPVNPEPVSKERFESCLNRVVRRRRSALRDLAR